MPPPPYLAEAKEKVDRAVDAAEAKDRSEAEIDELLRVASVSACEALNKFWGDNEYWTRVSQQSGVLIAIKDLIKKAYP